MQKLFYINSKTACRGFDSFCPCHVGASFISLALILFKNQSALIPLLLLSKSNPLRWASIWVFLALKVNFNLLFLLKDRNHLAAVFFRHFLGGLFWADRGQCCFDAQIGPSAADDSARFRPLQHQKSIKASAPQIGICQPEGPSCCFMRGIFCVGSEFKSRCDPRQSGGVFLDIVQFRDFRG